MTDDTNKYYVLSSIPVFQMKSVLDEAEFAFLRNNVWLRLDIIISFASYKPYEVA